MPNFIDRIKVRLGLNVKKLEAPVDTLSIEEKELRIEQLLRRAYYTEELPLDSICEIIDSLPKEMQKTYPKIVESYLWNIYKYDLDREKAYLIMLSRYCPSNVTECFKRLPFLAKFDLPFVQKTIVETAPRASKTELLSIIKKLSYVNLSESVRELLDQGYITAEDLHGIGAYTEIADSFIESNQPAIATETEEKEIVHEFDITDEEIIEIFERFHSGLKDFQKQWDIIFKLDDEQLLTASLFITREFLESDEHLKELLIERIFSSENALDYIRRIQSRLEFWDAKQINSLALSRRWKVTLKNNDPEILEFDTIEQLWDFEGEDGLRGFMDAMRTRLFFLENHGELSADEYVHYLELMVKHNEDNKTDYYDRFRVSSIEKWIEIYKKNPSVISYTDYSNYSFEDLEKLFEFAKSDKSFQTVFLNQLNTHGKIDLEKAKKYMDFVIECGFSKEHRDDWNAGGFEKALISNIGESIGKLDSKHKEMLLKKSAFIFELFFPFVENQNEEEIDNLFNLFDVPQPVIDLYHSMSQKQIKQESHNANLRRNAKVSEFQLRFLRHLSHIIENYEAIERLKEDNPNILYTINYQLLDFLDGDQLEYFARYCEMQLIPLYGFEQCSDEIRKMISIINERIAYPEEYILRMLTNINQMRPEEFLQVFRSMDIEEMVFLFARDNDMFSTNSPYIIENYRKFQCELADRIIENPDSDNEAILAAYVNRFLGISYNEARELVKQYGENLDELIHIYQEKKESLSTSEQIEFRSLEQLRFLKELFKIDDVEVLRETYRKLTIEPGIDEIDYLELPIMEESIKRAYNREKIPQLYRPKETDLHSQVEYNGTTISVYEPKEDWNMIISVIGAYVPNPNAYFHPKAEWYSKKKNTRHEICTSIIGNDNMSMATPRLQSIIYGFSNISPESIEREAPYDIWSYSNEVEVQARSSCFMMLQELKNHVRRGHSEHLLETRTITEDGETIRTDPDYIIALNRITKADKRAASEFGIPIVLIRTRDIAKKESERISTLGREAMEELSPEKLREFVLRYHNNYAGLFKLDVSAISDYFSPIIMEREYHEIVAKISGITDTSKRLEMARTMMESLCDEEKKRKGIPRRFNPFDFKKIKESLTAIINEATEKKKKSLVEHQGQTTNAEPKRDVAPRHIEDLSQNPKKGEEQDEIEN